MVDKPAGWTSHDVVAKLRGATRQRRVGHAGTLDPDATGVLLVGLGRVTRLLRFLQETTKSYQGVVAFGVATSTLDAAGEELERAEMPVDETAVRVAMTGFVGDIEQVPPMVSAIKVDGTRLYELAREGKEVERAPRPVRIDRFDLEAFTPGAFPRATVLVECSSAPISARSPRISGRRSAVALTSHRCAESRVGAFTLADARPLEDLVADPEPSVVAPAAALRGMEQLVADRGTAALVANGRVFTEAPWTPATPGPFAVVDDAGGLLAVYEWSGERLKPSVVLPVAGPSGGGGDWRMGERPR